MSDVELSLDEALESLGMDSKPATREDELYITLTEGTHKKIANMRYWLIHEMAKYQFLSENNIRVTKNVMQDGKAVNKPLSKLEYAKLHIKYYLEMHHLPYFTKLDNSKEPADMAKMVDMLADYDDMRQVISKEY